ncbi:MAG TPA: DUF1003 domain-containing protein [Polyangiaceae bacterium]|nr:DUF1003 domain-containing protein [Polyangiaceae bacterium]
MQTPATCVVCQRSGHFPDLVRAASMRPSVAEHLARSRGVTWAPDGHVCQDCLADARHEHLLARMRDERGRLTELDVDVARRIRQHESVVLADESTDTGATTFGERVADGMARVGGSWRFVLGFVALLVLWTLTNGLVLRNRGFDPYPFILLNLVLSCLAALQAPIIMMSQNRAEARDRERAESDYRVNLKAEIEVAALHDKLDHVLHARRRGNDPIAGRGAKVIRQNHRPHQGTPEAPTIVQNFREIRRDFPRPPEARKKSYLKKVPLRRSIRHASLIGFP